MESITLLKNCKLQVNEETMKSPSSNPTSTSPSSPNPSTANVDTIEPLTSKLRQTLDIFFKDPIKTLNASFVEDPCFKKSFLWGTSLAGLLAAHRLHSSRSFMKTMDSSILGFLVGSGASYVNCTTTRSAERHKMNELQKKLNQLQQRKRRNHDKDDALDEH